MGHSTTWKPIWRAAADGTTETAALIRTTLTRREWVTLRRYARDQGLDRNAAMESVFCIGMAEISGSYDPAAKVPAAEVYGLPTRRRL